jgi:hypothetical protein
MSTHQKSVGPPGSLTRELWDVPIRVRLLPYVEFSRWLDDELEKLLQRWEGQAAPIAKKARRRP